MIVKNEQDPFCVFSFKKSLSLSD